MTVRLSMADLIARVRLLIHDAAGAGQVFDDQAVQDALDAHRIDVRYLELEAVVTLAPTGTQYLDYYADRGAWEADETLLDGGYNTLVPDTADRLTGHWTFAASQNPPVYIVGKSYDVYATAADLLEAWAAREKLSFDVDADGARFKRSQKAARLLELAQTYRRQQRTTIIQQVRDDVVV